MRRAILFVLLPLAALAVLLGRGDEGDATSARPAPLTEAELRWIRGYARWSIELGDAELATAADRRPFADCAAVLRTTAGRAPTPRLEEAETFVEDACAAITSNQNEGAIRDDLVRADELLSPFLLSRVELRETNEATEESRGSTLLSAIASAHTGEDVVVLCWSDRDWRRLIHEENAWSDGHDDAGLVDGMAFVEDGRVHMLLPDCNLLGRLRDERLADRNREGLIDATRAVTVFAHELQHFRLPEGTEAEVECAAVEQAARVGRDLGLDGEENELIHEVYGETVRPELAAEYRRPCS